MRRISILTGILLMIGAGAAYADPSHQTALSGKWTARSQSETGEQIAHAFEFTREGRFTLVSTMGGRTTGSARGSFAADGRAIALRDSEGAGFSMTYKLSGKRLTLVIGGNPVTFSKSAAAPRAPANAKAGRNIVVNGVRLTGQQLRTWQTLEREYRVRMPDRRYWYDPVSGMLGLEGGPAQGQIPARLRLGGKLRANAAGGRTHVYVNGLSVHPADVAGLERVLGPVRPGRYWLLADGTYGVEGSPRPMGNLFRAVNAADRGQGGNSFYRSPVTGNTVSSDGSAGYVAYDGKVIATWEK